jgi:hypothetical protein
MFDDFDLAVYIVLPSFRIGLLGFACSPAIREDNIEGGDEGSGNYCTC